MDNNQVNESVKGSSVGSSVSPIVNVRIPKEYQPLIQEAARLSSAGNISGFIRQSAIKEAMAVLGSAQHVPTLAS